MRHYFLIVALGEIFYGVVSAQNYYDYGQNTDNGNFPQNNPSQNWNQGPNQGGYQQNDYQQGGGMGPPRRRQFRQRPPDPQPQPPPLMNNYDYPNGQPPNQGYDNNWNPPLPGNTPDNYGNYDTGQTDYSQQGNNAPQPNYDKIPGSNSDDDVTTTASSTGDSSKKKKRKRRRKTPGSPPRKRRRRRRKDPEDPQRVDDSNANQNDDGEVPPGIPNDYPGYTYPPEFFSDLLGGLDDSSPKTGSSDTENQDDDKNTETGGGSTDSDDLVPEDIPNDYPGFSYPPDFFSDLFEGLEDSTQPPDTKDADPNNDNDVSTDSSQGDTRTVETTTLTKTTRKRKKRPPGGKRRRRRRPRGKSTTVPDDGGRGSDDQSGDDDSKKSSSRWMTPTQDYTSDSVDGNATDFLNYVFPGVDNSSGFNSQDGNDGKGFNMDDFLKEFNDMLKNRNHTNNANQNPNNNVNTSNNNSSQETDYSMTDYKNNNPDDGNSKQSQNGSNDSSPHKSTRSADEYDEDQQESPTDSTLQQDDEDQPDVTHTEDTITYSNSTRYVVTDGYKVKRRNGTRKLRTRAPGTKRRKKKKLRRKSSTPQSADGVPPGIPNDYPDYHFPPGFFDDLLDGLNVSTPFDDGASSTEDYSDTQLENPPGDIYETTTEGEMKYLPPDQVNDFTLIEPPPGVVCNANESYYKCVPHCKHTCFNYDSDEMCPVFCQEGCGCDQGLLIDEKGQCVHPDDCFELSCGLDEEWWDCKPTCHNTCKNFARAEACEDVECESGCFCRDGLILDSDGNCVEPEDCEDPTCHENEEETDCISPCNTCAANCRSCQFRSCREGCDCKDGFKRDSKGECVHASLCPPCTLPTSTLPPSTTVQ